MPYGLSNYRRTPIGLNTAAFADVVGIIRNNSLQADQQQSAIDLALAQLPVNAAEDEWRTNLSDEIKAGGENIENPADRLAYYTKAAGNVFNRPDVIGRIRAQAEYDNFVKQTQARQDLTEDDKAWALYNNPYSYSDVKDDNGRIIGGTQWKYKNAPVGMIDYNNILAEAKKLVFQETGGSQQVVFYDKDGNDITDPNSQSIEGVKYYKNGTWQGIDKNKLNNILESAIDNTPGARARLEQDWKVANWKYEQMTPEEQINNKPSELFASNGVKYTKNEWYNNKFGRAVNAMSGMNHTNTIEYDDNYSKFMEARRAGAILGSGNTSDAFGGQFNIITGLGTPAYIETESVVNKAFGKVESGMQDLENIIPGLKNAPLWVNAKNNGDYNKMVSIIKGGSVYKNLSDEEKQNVDQKLRDFNDNASLVSSVKANGGDFNAIAFNGAFTTGGELPGGNNPYTQQFMTVYNRYVGDNATQVKYTFEDEQELKQFAETIGLELNGKGYKQGKDNNGLPALFIPKNNPINYKALVQFDSLGYKDSITSISNDIRDNGLFVGLTRFRRRNAVGIDDEGNEQPSRNNLSTLSTVYNIISGKAKNTIGNITSNVIETTTKHMELPEISIARSSGLSPSEEKSTVDNAIDKVINNINGMNGSQYKIMTFDEDTNSLKSSNIKDRTALLEDVKAYIRENRSSAKDIIGIRIIDGKVGYRIQIPKIWNKSKNSFVDGDIVPNEIVIFNPDDEYLNSMQNRTDFVAATKYDRLSRVNGASHITYDNNEIKFGDNGNVFVNGIASNRTIALQYMDRDEAYSQIKESLPNHIQNVNGELTLSKNMQVTIANFVKDYYGYEIGTPPNIEKATDIITQMINELK